MNLSWGPLHAGLQSVLNTALDAVVVMSADGIIVGWNDFAADCFGWRRDEAQGQRLSALIIPPALREQHERGLAHYLATGEGPVLNRRIEISALHRQGHEFPVELSITASDQFGETLFVGFIRDISDRREEAERQFRLLQESDHRVKNMLTVVSAIAKQTARNSKDLASFEKSFSGRLEALASAHRLLVGSDASEVALSALAEQVLGGDVAAGRARYSGPEVQISGRQVLGLSMILHELYTNSVKYGALCKEAGDVSLEWRLDGECLELRWSEAGDTCVREEARSGFGEKMIDMSVKSDLGGTIEREWRPEGLLATLRFRIAAAEDAEEPVTAL